MRIEDIGRYAPHEIVRALAEQIAPLKRGARIDLTAMDFASVVDQFKSGLEANYDRQLGPQQTFFTAPRLVDLARGIGLRTLRCQQKDGRLILSARKRLKPESVQIFDGRLPGKVASVISMGRLGFTETWHCAMGVLPPLGIPLATHTGAFWEQSMQTLLEDAVENNDYIVTLDHDSVFSRAQFLELLSLIEDTPDAMAVFPMQMKRFSDHPIFGLKEDGKMKAEFSVGDFICDLTPATFGHFGLTIIRCAKLKQLKKPWFRSRPNNKGQWRKGKVDADVDFWLRVGKAGMKLYQANHVRIGHIQEVYTFPDANCKPIHVYPDEFNKRRQELLPH